MRHINFFLWVQNGGFLVGAKKVMLKKLMCFFRPLKIRSIRGSKSDRGEWGLGVGGHQGRGKFFYLQL